MDVERKAQTIDDIREYVKNAKSSLCIIGSSIFDLHWDDSGLFDALKESFKNGLVIKILRESETALAQYELIAPTSNNNRGIDEFKQKLSNDLDGRNIEPVVDAYWRELMRSSSIEQRKYFFASCRQYGWEPFMQAFLKKKIEQLREKWQENLLFSNNEFVKRAMLDEDETTLAIKKDLHEYVNGVGTTLEGIFSNKEFQEKLTFDEYSDAIRSSGFFMELKVDKGGEFLNVRLKLDVGKYSFSFEQKLYVNRLFFDIVESDLRGNQFSSRLYDEKKMSVLKGSEKRLLEIELFEEEPQKKQRLFIKNTFLPIPVPMIEIDGNLFVTQALTAFKGIKKFQYVGNMHDEKILAEKSVDKYENSYWFEEFKKYYVEYFEKSNLQKYSTEETKKGDRKEIIDMFNENRVRIGAGPRDAFLDNPSIVKTVVWALIFDRNGNLLIHRRADNAKDNQGLWDKSVGGHVRTKDIDTIEAIKREITEELYTIENEGQGGHDNIPLFHVNLEKIIYLGEWKPERVPLKSLKLKDNEYYCFMLNYPDIMEKNFRKILRKTVRILPDGTKVEAKSFVDAFLCIVANDFNLENLKNSKYAMITPEQLKNCLDSKNPMMTINPETRFFDSSAMPVRFEPTFDLEELIDDRIIWKIVEDFSETVAETFSRNERVK